MDSRRRQCLGQNGGDMIKIEEERAHCEDVRDEIYVSPPSVRLQILMRERAAARADGYAEGRVSRVDEYVDEMQKQLVELQSKYDSLVADVAKCAQRSECAEHEHQLEEEIARFHRLSLEVGRALKAHENIRKATVEEVYADLEEFERHMDNLRFEYAVASSKPF